MGGRAGEASIFPSEGPANFDPAHPYADPAAAFAQREHIVREKLVKVETAKVHLWRCRLKRVWPGPQILRARVQQCYRTEGVNHYENCREHVNAYLDCIKDVGLSRINWTKQT